MVWTVGAATWVRGLTDDRIEGRTDAGTFGRGLDYARSGMVTQAASLNRGRVIVAQVSGSGPASYQTIVSLESDPEDVVVEWSARCSCPVGSDCKHSVAVLLSVRDDLGGVEEAGGPGVGGAAAPVASWEATLAGLTGAVEPAPLRSGVPLALIIEMVIAPTDRFDRVGVPRLRIRPTRWTKAGRWAKKFSWREARGHDLGHAVPHKDSHRRVVDVLASLHESERERHRYGYGRAYGAPEPALHLDDYGPELWQALQRVRDAGVALIASEAGEPVTLDDGPVEVVVDVVRDEEGLLLRPRVETDLAGDVAPEVHLLGDPAHGVALSVGDEVTLAPFADGLGPGVADLVRTADPVRVPEADVDRFLALYLGPLREQITVVSSDASVDLPEPVPPRLHVRVRGADGGVRLELGFAYAAGARLHVVPAGAGGGVPRDAKGEQALLAEVGAMAEIPGAVTRAVGSTRRRLQSPITLRGASAIRVLTDVVPLLEDDTRVVVVIDEDAPVFEELLAEPQIAVQAAGDESHADWLDLGLVVTIGEVEVPFEPLFQALVREEGIMQLSTGEWFRLDHPVLAELRSLIEEARALAEPAAGEVRLSRYQVDLWDDLTDLGEVEIEREHAWRASVEALRSLETDAAPTLPTSLEATLRPYQVEGYHWLATLWDAGLGGVLADDMGLGKTVQTLALLARALEAGELDRPVLVVAPTSVVGTWVSEAERFVPDLEVRTLGQTHRRRGTTVGEAVAGAHLVVTSYAVLRIDAEEFAEVPWRGVILDEAQFVKNSRAKSHQAVGRLSAPFVLAVTGTPLENSLMDLWSLLALAAPGLYPQRDRFSEVYRKPIESGAQPERLDRLRRRIRPLMLRRTKEQVALDLPPKQVQVLPVDLAPTHRRIYDRHLQRERKRVLGLLEDPDANRVAILASLTRLRQLSLDPGLVDEDHRGQGSAKVDVLVEHLRELAGEGHRALVFSQFTRFLRLVRERLEAEGVSTSYLDGTTTDRAEVVREFREGDAAAFLISLKAGGTGLTLTEADYVFVLDPWWNPAAEAQAIDRAHRIGQDKPVMVYRLVSTGTIEEKVLALQERKRDLFERVVDDGGALSGRVTSEDIRALLDAE
ncbi:MAG: DEAD/DEAH box helicase [Janibacter sp.]